MNMLTKVLISSTLFSASMTASAANIAWTDWTDADIGLSGNATGLLDFGSGSSIDVTYNGEISFAQLGTGTNYFLPSTPYVSSAVENAPTASEMIAINGGNTIKNTVTFSEAVVNPVFTIVSLGRASLPTRYEFDQSFSILSQGPGYFGGSDTSLTQEGNTLFGREGHGALVFNGTFDSISWTVPTAEYWHGFTVGALSTVSPVPEMEIWAMMLGGLACIGWVKKKKI
ncbi:MAG: hypothetical protein V4629_11805 [Pseudomonadota bacterium]